ncbi:glycine zipper family protein [Meridianimarinicoccus roseus]|jgi:hypothetical protein|uniref:Glycine zipper family protein n=1 Tax=Meridianimarinicoccus roseus TaxID=2072018 RepID=A0A2V2LLR6_9RHOB|nr:glycine zipper family protein [Meridianimarinicoccus roseus]PWR02703.1 glycine zipper family protein [Meridianimarinicoccus roseus]
MRHLRIPAALLPVALAACGAGADYTPIVDGTRGATFEHDLAACRALAREQDQLNQEAIAAAVLGAGVGAMVGGLDDSLTVEEAALGGLVIVGGSALADGTEKREEIVTECMRGRGHRVVG